MALTLAIAGAVSAATTPWGGDVDEGGNVAFELKGSHKTGKVRHFTWEDVPMTCTEGPGFTGDTIDATLILFDGGRFRFGAELTETKTKVVGEFTSKHKAKGTIRAQGALTGMTDCDTGKVHWHASDEA